MRKSLLFLATAIIVGWSCARVEENAMPEKLSPGVKMTFIATLGDQLDGGLADTKTALQPADENNKRAIWWTPGDAINIFYGTMSGSKFVTEITEPKETATFNGTLGAATGSSEAGMSAQTFWGIYPYNADNTCDGTGVTLTIPDGQEGLAGGFADKLNPTVANSPGLGLSFYNVGSWFIFTVTQEGITSLTLKGNNGENIAGKVRVTMDSNGKPVSTVMKGFKSITIMPGGGGSFVVGEEYRIVLVPQTLSSGITVTMRKGTKTATLQITSSLNFKRSSYLRKKNADSGLDWVEDVHEYVEMGDGLKWATMNVGASKTEDYGDYFAWGEPAPNTYYNWSTYFDDETGNGTAFTKYGYNKLTQLELEDDTANTNWGGTWRMPTHAEWLNLQDTTKFVWTWIEDYKGTGTKGQTVTSKISGYSGNSIFLPAAGYRYGYADPINVGSNGYYWSSSLTSAGSQQARRTKFNRNGPSWNSEVRYYGESVRPVSN